MQRQETPFSVALGYVVGPTIWISFLALMAYGLWIQAWYGYVMAAVIIAGGIAIWVSLYRARRSFDAEIERLARNWNEDDYPPRISN